MWKNASEVLTGTVHARSRQGGMLQAVKIAQSYFGKTIDEGLLVKVVRSHAEAEAVNMDASGIDITYAVEFEAIMREEVEE
jgi:hypothetical protein